MEMIAAPARQFKTYSMWIGIFIAVINALMLLIGQLGDIEILTPQVVLIVNAFFGALIVPAKLILQNISVTTEEKRAIISASATVPVINGEKDLTVKIGNKIVSR